jgi:pimeloyl-ACP methyl ester carboxylesterase
MALDDPDRVAGLVLLAPVAYPWPGGIGRYNEVIATPLIGRLLAYTITLPLGCLVTEAGVRGVFAPQVMPAHFVRDTATPLLLRPREFIANAQDLVTLKAAVVAQAPRYAEITAPITIIAGDADKTVSTTIHSRPLSATAPNARLIVLPGVGHMVQDAAPDLVVSEIEAMAGRMARPAAAAQ